MQARVARHKFSAGESQSITPRSRWSAAWLRTKISSTKVILATSMRLGATVEGRLLEGMDDVGPTVEGLQSMVEGRQMRVDG